MAIIGVNSTASLFSNVGGKEKTAQKGSAFAQLLDETGGGSPNTAMAAGANKDSTSTAMQTQSAGKKNAVQEFMEYMKMTPAERWQEAWLRAHGLTKEQFDALPADKKAALIEEMKQEMQEQMRQQARNNKDGKTAPAVGML